MKNTTNELMHIINTYAAKIKAMAENEFSSKPTPEKWSAKEVLGHLIDSAQNNLRRFIVSQYEKTPQITYDPDFWVAANNYQQMKKDDVITLWKLLNAQIASVLDNMPATHYPYLVNTGKEKPDLRTVEWLASDYVKHMKHHLNQIIPGSFDIVYH